MAEAIFNHLVKEQGINAVGVSAGTIPAFENDRKTLNVLLHHGIATELNRPQKINDDLLERAEHIISFGCLTPEMIAPEQVDKFEEWLVADPHNETEYQATFDTIYEKVRELLGRVS